MKIALAQMKVVAGHVQQNRQTLLRFIQDAKKASVDLIVFPEMCTHGYLVGDKWLSRAFCRSAHAIAEELIQASDGIAIAWGSVYLEEHDKNKEHEKSKESEESKEDKEDKEDKRSKGYHPNKDGRDRKYNAVYVAQNQRLVKRKVESPILPSGVAPKTLLPNYRIFDDQRYFFSLEDIAKDFHLPLEDLVQPFLIKDRKGREVPILFQICEDMWARDYRANRSSLNITKMGIDNGAELIINLSASPWTYGKNGARDRRIRYLQASCGDQAKPFLYVNCVGVQNNGKNFVTFDGGSTVYNRAGEAVQQAPEPYQESLMLVDTDQLDQQPSLAEPIKSEPTKSEQTKSEQTKSEQTKSEQTKSEQIRGHQTHAPIAEKCEAIVQGIRSLKEIVNAREYPKFVIGLSGGVDSAVVAALLVHAVGADHVTAINMPSQWNSEATKGAAKQLADALGIAYYVVPISETVRSVETMLSESVLKPMGSKWTSLAKENVQAKVRGTDVLSNIAGNHRWLFTNNGNKLEIALGYATLYGDVGGSIAPIGDLLKTEVFAMGHYLNDEIFKREVVPYALLPDELCRFDAGQIKPSAELEADQEDPMKFGYHDALLALATDYNKWDEEDIVEAYREGSLHHHIGSVLGRDDDFGRRLMERWGVDKAEVFVDDLRWFFAAINNSVFKRVQAPGIVITSRSAFGFDIRESMLPDCVTDQYRERVVGLKDY